MSLTTLQFVRFLAPAIIFVVFGYVLLKMLQLTSEDAPVSVNDLGYNLSYLIIAAIYAFIPLRKIAQAPYMFDVNEHIRTRLVAMSKLPDDARKFAWSRVKNVFYCLVDNDKSLETRVEIVRFNGALMSCFADLTAISFLFVIGCEAAMAFGVPADRALAILLAVFVLSLWMQLLATRRHEELAEDQLAYIEQQLLASVQTKMTALNA